VWPASLPYVVPDDGALGERVATLGGGWRLPPGFTGADAAALLARLFSPEGTSERARVESAIWPLDPVRIPTLEAMSRDVDALYARFALPSATTTDAHAARDALAPLLAANLDGFVFRKELLSLAGQLEQALADVAEAKRWSAQLERDGAAWAAKLEADIATLRRDYTVEIQRFAEENRRLGRQNARLDEDNRRFARQNARLDEDNRRLGKENVRQDEEIQGLRQLAGQLEQVKTALDEAPQRSAQQERDSAERAAKYRDELAILGREHASEVERFTERIRRVDDEIRQLADENRRLADEIARLATYKAAFELGPELAQKYLLRKLSRARR
jgi:DNA repair exonuclease SbcCD ATPase subunit